MEKTAAKKVSIVLAMNDESNRKKLAGVFDYLRGRIRWNVTLAEPNTLTTAALRGADGLLLDESRPWRRRPDVPAVVMHLPQKRDHSYSYVVCDNHAIAETVSAHAREEGFRSFAYVHPHVPCRWSEERCAAFTALCGTACRTWSSSDARDLSTWLRDLPPRTFVFAADDSVARDVMLRCTAIGLDVPGDIAIVGVDNDELLCESSPVPLTSVEPDFRRAGQLAAELLDEMMRGAPLRVLRYGAARIVVRESSRHVAYHRDARIVRALEFIRRNAQEPIGVADVARVFRASRRTVELVFRKKLKRTVASLIRLARLDAMMRRVKGTSLTTAEICATSGFQSESHAKRAFKLRFGKPMSAFRPAPPVPT